MKRYAYKTFDKRFKKLQARRGERVWTRHLILETGEKVRVFLSDDDLPSFRCIFLKELSDKYIQVIGPDGLIYKAHKSYAGKNPAVTVSFCGMYHPSTDRWSRALRHYPGTLIPDESCEVVK